MPRKETQYEPGTYGAWLQMRIRNLAGYIRSIQKNDGDLQFWQESAAAMYSQISLLQKHMSESGQTLTDPLPGKETMGPLYEKSRQQSESPEFMEPFSSENIDKSMELFGMNGQDQPTPEELLQTIAGIQEQRQQTTQQREERQTAAPKRAIKYAANTYGAYMENLAATAHENVQKIGELFEDPDWQNQFSQSAKMINVSIDQYPPLVQKWEMYRQTAGMSLTNMFVLQKRMNDQEDGLDDPMPSGDWQFTLGAEAQEAYAKNKDCKLMFDPGFFDSSMHILNLDRKNPPTVEQVLMPFSNMMQERLTSIQAAKDAQKEKRVQIGSLVNGLKKSEQKSFYGKLKSFFVGNSKEYDKAIKAMEGFANGKTKSKEVKEAIKAYLDLRGNKVRDHAFGRDRFDMMMKSLAQVSTPAEMMEYCEKIDDARDMWSNGTYSERGGKIDLKEYLSEDQIIRGKEEMRLRDLERLEADKDVHGRAYEGFTADLNKLKNEKGFDAKLRQNLKTFMVDHPMVRGAAQAFVEKNGLNFRVPEPPKGMSDDVRDKADRLDHFLRQRLGVQQKQQQKQNQGPSREA